MPSDRSAERFLTEVRDEWRRACEMHQPMGTVLEAAVAIREEYEELWDEVCKNHHDKARLRGELMQVAAMCVRAVVDLDLRRDSGSCGEIRVKEMPPGGFLRTRQDFILVLQNEQEVRTCRECGCTDERACPGGCSWVEEDLCSACAKVKL